MISKHHFEKFVAEKVLLTGSNLIEASAGTGKTFSIAILVLRLLLEKKIQIQEILMVTFTNAAVAELEERIRLFIRNAYRYSRGEGDAIEKIRQIVDRSIEDSGKVEVQQLLKSAVLNLDETSVMTIHGFCQQTLNEFAFETSQLFSAELIQDTSDIIDYEINRFWRKRITRIQIELLSALSEVGINRDGLRAVLNGHLSGKDFIFYDENKEFEFDTNKQNEYLLGLNDSKSSADRIEAEMTESILNNQDELIKNCEKNANAKKSFQSLVNQPKKFIDQLIEKINIGYVPTLFPELFELTNQLLEQKNRYKNLTEEVSDYLCAYAIQEIVPEIENHKVNFGLLSFDDMISNLNKALAKKDEKLSKKLQNKYKSVFIDEFQDTDRKQYEIFQNAFGKSDTVIFFIGDPKQSIYAWRKADIATYLKARGDVENRYSMNTNFRSSSRLIAALNQFFLPQENFDTFHFKEEIQENHRIEYLPVESPENNSKSELKYKTKDCAPVSIIEYPNNPEIYDGLAKQILELLNDKNYTLFDSDLMQRRNIKPSDIGVLVRNNSDGKDIKSELAKRKIPSVTVSDEKILRSLEAKEMVYLLEAVVRPKQSSINRALMSVFIGFDSNSVLKSDEEKFLQKFKDFLEYWKSHGIYATLMKMVNEFGIQQRLIGQHTENGERTLTNLYHLTEILYKTENRQHLNPVEVLDWLIVNVEKSENDEDEYQQRIENDEDAIKIVTIHSSKGLQYQIIFAPGLDMTFTSKNDRVYGFRKPDGKYVTAKLNQLTTEQTEELKSQDEQENRRLLYVALTRAVYKCFIYHSTSNGKGNSTLSYFMKNIEYGELIEKDEPPEIQEDSFYTPKTKGVQQKLIASNFKLLENNWFRMSYSALAAHNEFIPKETYLYSEETYDSFVFNKLKKGNKTGNFLHFIFENIDFSRSESWSSVVDRAVKRFLPKRDDGFLADILSLIEHVMSSQINTGEQSFQLKSVPAGKCLHELEFDFPVKSFSADQLKKLKENGVFIDSAYTGQIEGIMNGKIDLFFEYEKKYYILDWKSNYLGPSLTDYTSLKLMDTMDENNYHLQYLIYSFATKKYLESRLGSSFDYERDFGGVLYLFVRGMRKDTETGVFYTKPTIEKIKLMEKLFDRLLA